MEESIRKLKQFLGEVSHAESKVDAYRNKLYTKPEAREAVFQAIDANQHEEISSVHICQFCERNGLKTTEKDAEIIGRYFRNWNEPVKKEQFCEFLRPKIEGLDLEEQVAQEPTSIFLSMVETIINSFKALQILREEMTECSFSIMKYFRSNYQSNSMLTKENIKQFMIDQDLYTRRKFAQISNYIFGEKQNQIAWSSFFFKKDGKQVTWIGTQKSIKKEEEIEKSVGNSRSRSKTSYKGFQEVLTQIQEIEKSMKDIKDKKERRSNKKIIFPKQCQKIEQQAQKYMPTIKEQDQKYINLPIKIEEQAHHDRYQNHQEENHHLPDRYHNHHELKEENYHQHQYRAEGRHKRQNSDNLHNIIDPTQKIRDISCRKLSIGLKKSPSEAQIKINEIERRAMDKYLNSRKQRHLPNDGYIPYYHVEERQSQELCRMRKNENYHSSKIEALLRRVETPLMSRVPHVYPRNNFSRGVYDGYGFECAETYRALSPRFMRY